MEEAKQGCWLGCAALATLLVLVAAGLLIYVATHRDEWRASAASQTRAYIEEQTQRVFPEDVSVELIQLKVLNVGVVVELPLETFVASVVLR